MYLANIFNSEVINYECEADWLRIMFPETHRLITLAVAMLFKPFFKQFLRYNSCMGQTVHPANAFDVHKLFFIYLLLYFVLFDDVFWEAAQFNTKIFWSVHRRVEVEIL